MKYFFFLLFLSLYINVSAQYNNKNYIIDNSKLKLNNINFNYNVKSFNIKLKSTKNKDPKIDFHFPCIPHNLFSVFQNKKTRNDTVHVHCE